jgi:SAM-dependent methyltransferase
MAAAQTTLPDDTGRPLNDFDADAWQHSWDRQQEVYLPDREHRFAHMLDIVDAITDDHAPAVLDLAGGTGSISLRLLRRFPRARTTLLDVDPVLLSIAQASLDDRTTILPGDLRTSQWTEALDRPAYDAVLTATALHWLDPDRLADLYREIRDVLRPGGVFINADHMPDDGLPTLSERLATREHSRQEALWTAGAALSWDGWWDHLTADPTLGPLVVRRAAVFSDWHPDEITPNVSWHLQAMRDAGYTEVGVVWRGARDAAVTAVR